MNKIAKPVACVCSQCGRTGMTRRPRPAFLCIRCYIEKDLGRPLEPGDIVITSNTKEQGS